MKMLATFETLATLTSSGETAGFPDDNVKALDPMVRWKADAYEAAAWLKVDFGSAKSLTALFLNQANFPAATIQGNASDSWETPSFTMSAGLVQDDAENRKGWFDLTAFNYRWLRVLIPAGQTLDNSELVPALGNLIVGTSITVPLVSDLTPLLIQRKSTFEADGGGYYEAKKGRARQVIQIGIGDTLANVRAMPKTWDIGVIFADLGSAGDVWLVFPPDNWDKPIKSILESQLRLSMKEYA